MSEGASSSSDAAVRLSIKRSSDSSNSESETKRLHTDHSTRDVVMLLDDSDVSHAVERCREVCRRKGTFLVDVNDWDCESRDNFVLVPQMVHLLLAPVVEPPRNSSRTSCVSSISLLQPAIAMVTCRGKQSRSLYVNTNVISWGRLGIVKSSTQLWSIVPRWRRKTS